MLQRAVFLPCPWIQYFKVFLGIILDGTAFFYEHILTYVLLVTGGRIRYLELLRGDSLILAFKQ